MYNGNKNVTFSSRTYYIRRLFSDFSQITYYVALYVTIIIVSAQAVACT